jgi:endonuclease/exonuclease/phosphatase family metal-dependent hydrolase
MNKATFNTPWVILATFALLLYTCNTQRKKENNPTSSGLRIITYNVWYGFSEVPERKSVWLAWMNEQDPDIVSLQELNGYTDQKLAEDARSYGHAYSAILKEDGFPTGITSRYPIEDIQRIREGFQHGLLRVRIKGIYIYVIHLHPSNWEIRKAEIHQILGDIERLPPESKVILAGDFNTFSSLDSSYYTHDRLETFFSARDSLYDEMNLNNGQLDYTVIQDILNYGFIDTEARERDPFYIFSGSFPSRIEKEGEHGDHRRLDYIFVSKNLAKNVKNAAIIANDTTHILSDHLPVFLDLQFSD